MSNVHEFPQDKQVKKQLDDLKESIEELLDTLNRGYDLVDALESRLATAEESYNDTLERYGNAVGMENIPVGYLEYATKNVSLDMEGAEIVFKWEPENEDEEV
jgi:predicted RNase H-like nuclease (RuvC/YqgF family)